MSSGGTHAPSGRPLLSQKLTFSCSRPKNMLIMLMNVPFGQDKLAVKKWQVVELRSKKRKERHYDVYFLLNHLSMISEIVFDLYLTTINLDIFRYGITSPMP